MRTKRSVADWFNQYLSAIENVSRSRCGAAHFVAEIPVFHDTRNFKKISEVSVTHVVV